MSKHNLNVSLSFTADTSKAKANIADLSKSLQQIAKMPGSASSLFDDTKIRQASQAALELQQHLSKAVNVDTGKLDLSRFSSSLKASNQDLHQYCNTLLNTGKQGQQAFLQLAQAIAAADTPVTRVNKKLAEMGVTLKNTIRWQLSSSMLHGFMSTISGANRYAEDLNESLNNIRIVTGQNVDQMKEFAVQANRAAKALSTTTTKYTDASLIYYQQGLSDAEVAERTEVTVKMANVARQSAEVVSDQMTAVWNNFYDGSKSLEYYADVMTALGAATATSTDEIAGGLEKFAAIGDTIGLSYEYAAGALATITSNTRQSEEVVGTALKTIFARIQGLNLGDTLEDGTTLNKYSQALDKVGISIFDQNNQIKTMDTLLDEMANKWANISKDQQIALAQTVAGTRQYTQLVALMDNWNNGDNDSMMANLNTINTSSGALDKQADIYAESWEAAENRVKAAAQNIYDSLIDDEFMIDLYNGFEKLLEGVGGFVDGLGGMKGILTLVGSIFMQRFAKEMPTALNNLKQNFMVFTGQAKVEMQKVQDSLDLELNAINSNSSLSQTYKVQAEGIAKVNAMKKALTDQMHLMSKAEIEEEQRRIDNVKAMYDEAAALQDLSEKRKSEIATQVSSLQNQSINYGQGLVEKYYKTFDDAGVYSNRLDEATANEDDTLIDHYKVKLEEVLSLQTRYEQEINEFNDILSLGIKEQDFMLGTDGREEAKAQALNKIKTKIQEIIQKYADLSTKSSTLDQLTKKVAEQAFEWERQAKAVSQNEKQQTAALDEMKRKMLSYLNLIQRMGSEAGLNNIVEEVTEMRKAINESDNIVQLTEHFQKFSDTLNGSCKQATEGYKEEILELQGVLGKIGLNPEQIQYFKSSLEQAGFSAAQVKLILNQLGISIKGVEQKTFQTSEVITQFGSSLMSLSSLLTSIKSAWSVLWDEEAGDIEKISAAIGVLTSFIFAWNSVSTLSVKIQNSSALANIVDAKAKDVNAGATNRSTKAIQWNAAALKAHPIFYLATVIAAVTLAVKGLTLLLDAFSTETVDEKLERIHAETEALESATERAKNRYEELLTTINGYNSAIDKLKTLKEGTYEFTQELLKANEQAQELIEKYNLLATDYRVDENGVTIIDQDALNAGMREEQDRVENVNSALAFSKMRENDAKLEKDQFYMKNPSTNYGELDLEKYRAAIINDFGSLDAWDDSTDEDKKIKALTKGYYDSLNPEDEGYIPDVKGDLNQLYQIMERLNSQYFRDYDLLATQTQQSNDMVAQGLLRNNLIDERFYQDSSYKQHLLNQYGNSDYFKQIANEQVIDFEGDELIKEYQKALEGLYIVDDTGNVYEIDENAEDKKGEQVKDLSGEDKAKEYFQAIQADSQITDEINREAVKLENARNSLSESNQKIMDAFINEDFSKFSLEELLGLQGKSAEDLKKAYPFLNTLETFGIDVDELLEDTVVALDEWDPGKVDLNTSIDKLKEVKEAIQDLEFGDIIDQDTFDKLGEDAQQFFAYMGDGNYQLVADAKKFYDIIMGNASREMLNSIIEGRNQLDYLRQETDLKKYQINSGNYSSAVEEGFLTQDEADAINNAPKGLESIPVLQAKVNSYIEYLDNTLQESEASEQSGITSYLASAQTIEQLNNRIKELNSSLGEGQYTNESYAAALMSIGVQYENCESEIIKYQEAIISGTPEEIEHAKNILETTIALEEIAEKYDIAAESLKLYKEQIEVRDENNLRKTFENDTGEGYATNWLDELQNTDIEAYNNELDELAIIQARLSKGFDKLSENWEDWNNILSDNESTIEDIVEVMDGLKEVLADVLNWDADDVELLPADFGQKYRKEINDVYNGVDGAIERLQGLATSEYVATLGIDDNLTPEAEAAYNELNNFLMNMPDLEVGMTLDDIGVTEALNTLLEEGAITVDQLNDILSKIQFDPSLEYEEITIDGQQAQTYLTQGGFTKVNPDGSTTWVPLENRIEADGLVGTTVRVPKLKGKSVESSVYKGGGGVTAKAPTTRSKGGGGGGGSKKPAEKVNKSDVVKRYKEIDDKLASNTSAMNKANTAAEGLWGPERFKNMRKSIDLMEEENELLKERMDLSKQYMEEDRAALDEAAANAGLNFTFNNKGYITNYTEQMTKLYEEQAALIERANADGGVDESEQEQLDAMEKRVSAVTEAIENYEASLEESISDEEKFLENQREIWQANFDLWNEELELKITINEKDLKVLEYFMNKNSDSVFNNAGIEGYDGMIGDYESNTKEYQDSLEDLEKKYADGDIGPEQYKEGIADLIDRTLGDAEAMADLKEQLQNRLTDEISLVEDELAALNEQFDHLNSVLDHYASIMELTGKSKDFDAMGDIYKSQADNFKNSAEVYQQQYEMYKDEADKYYELMQGAEYGSNEYETYKASWEAAQAAQNEAQEQMLANTEEWVQAMRACIENEFEKIADVLEKSLTAEYGSMDNMITAMERANSLQEEYLTTTNKVYETDKLMRQAQQEIDKSTNSVAKKKLKSYIEETQQLQDQTELSQYELEIQQAKYDLILAEIALEEAQSAKSTVRLQRDAEGNFGYVYTADSEKIAEAEQGLEDAQNRLYNIALEGANDYSQKQMETLQEMYDALKELQIQYLDGEFETEQAYQKAMEDTKKFYYEKLEQYSSLHAVALATDSRVIADAWSSDFNDIIGKTEEWKDAVELYTDEAGKLIAEWAGIVSTALANTGLDDTAKATEEVDKKSKDLRDTIIGEDGESGLVSALEKEIDAISAATKGMIDYQKEIDKAIESNEKLAAQLNEDYKVMPEVKEEPQPEPEETKNNTNDTNKDTGNGNEKSGPSWDKVYSAYQKIISGEWGNGYENRVSKGKAAGYSAEEVQLAQELVNKVYSGLSLQSAKSALGFNTGGYTGAWSGDEGKLAFLHQKELVLNAGDTENFLMSMEVLERILRVIDLQTFSSQFGGLLTSPGLQSQGEQTIEQYITIEANFPEATDRFEIEEAFNSLANLASQYVNRK